MDLFEKLTGMPSIWKPTSVDIEPHVRLSQWRVYEVKADFNNSETTVHFVGDCGYEGRVSSAVKKYDPLNKRGVTQSGRVYELVGNSGYNGDAMHTWAGWCRVCKATQDMITDVSNQYE